MMFAIIDLVEKTDSERYKRAFDEARVGMIFADENSIITEVNQAFCHFLEYEKEELIGKSVADITSPEDRAVTKDILDKLHEGEVKTISLEKRYLTKTGKVVWGLVNPTSIAKENNQVQTFTVVKDITAQKQLESTLRESEEAYEQLVELSPDAIAVHSGGLVVFVNDTGVKLLGGKSKNEVIGRPTMDFVHPDSADKVKERIKMMMTTDKPAPLIEEKFLKLDGSVIDVQVAAKAISYRGNPSILVVIHDVTEQKHMIDILKEKEDLLLKAQMTANLGVYVLDVSSGTWESSEILDRLFGIDKDYPHTVEGWVGLVKKDQQEMMGRYFREEVVGQGGRFDKEYAIIRPNDKEERWLHGLGELYKDSSGQITKMVGTIRDITDEKKSKEKLEESEGRYRALAEASNDMIFVLLPDGTIDYANTYAAKSFRVIPEQMVGRNKIEFFGKEISERQDKSIAKVYETGEPFYIDNLTTFGKRELWLSTWLVPLKDETGKVIKVMGVSRDITPIKEVEKLRDDFFVIASHELRAPMTAIKWLVQMMQKEQYGKLDDRMRDPLVNIENSTERLIRLVNDLISAARIEASDVQLKLSVFDIRQTVDEVVNTFISWAKNKKIILEADQVNSVMVYADKDKVVQIVNNLIDNAIKFTPDGGKITLRSEQNERELRLEITDTGVGIPEEAKGKLFGKFSQISSGLETRPEGTGLGLFISREFAQAMGGSLVLQRTEVNKGSTFVFSLPLKKD